MRRYEAGKFHYSSYWHTWSRVLLYVSGRVVEVNLTPIPNCYSSTWENDVRPIWIREHGTGLDRADEVLDELPADVLVAMKANLGDELVHRLLTEDFFSQVDWEKYRRVCNGGANLADIRKD